MKSKHAVTKLRRLGIANPNTNDLNPDFLKIGHQFNNNLVSNEGIGFRLRVDSIKMSIKSSK